MTAISDPDVDEPVVRRRGRQRDDSIDVRVMDATRALLTTVGYNETTIASIARRSGVSPSTIYRRWPSRIEVIEEAIFPGFAPDTLEPTGDIDADMRRFVLAYKEAFSQPAARAAVPGLMTVYQTQTHRAAPAGTFSPNMRPHFKDMMAAAATRGSINPQIDADDILDLLVGAVMYKVVFEPHTVRAGATDRTAELLVQLIRRSSTSS